MPGAGFRAIGPPNHSGLRAPYNGSSSLRTPYNGNRYNGNRLLAGRPAPSRSLPGRPSYDPRAAGLARSGDRDRFDARRRQFQSWYVSTYPYWPGFPYLLDPNFYNLGLYDWGDSDNSAPGSYESDSSQPGSDESGNYEPGSYEPGSYEPGSYEPDQDGPPPPYPPPYPNQGPPYSNDAPLAQAGAAAPAVPAPALSAQPLTVIFKGGRAPIEVENYLMTAKVLTDLDSEHYEQIPLDQIDLAATKRFNTFAGVDFQIPAPSRN